MFAENTDMKYLLSSFIVFSSFFLLQSSSCKHDDNNNASPGGGVSGNWRVSSYYDNDKDETSDFAGYVFAFQNGGVLMATRNGQTTTGSWFETTNDRLPRLVLNLHTSDDKLNDVNDDWVIVSRTGNEIKLRDDNTSKNEQLHFVRQ